MAHNRIGGQLDLQAYRQPRRGTLMSRELHHFTLLTREQQAEAIRRMASQGWSDHSIAHATRRCGSAASDEPCRRLHRCGPAALE